MGRLQMNQRGDTIVEVLISLAVMSMVIGGAYTIINSALRASRQAQERSEATKIAESQVETLKSEVVVGADADSIPTGRFCFTDQDNLGHVVFTGLQPPADFQADNYANYPNACKSINNLYNVFITSSGQTYTVNVRWDRIGGGKEQVQMVYRSYR